MNNDHDSTLQHYLSTWNLSNPQPLAQTITSQLYMVTHDHTTVVLKILTAYGKDEGIGALALQHFNGQGAVRLLRSDERAHLLEYADGHDLTGLVQNGQDEQATTIIGNVVNALHANQSPPPPGIPTLRQWFQPLFDQAQHHPELIQAASVADQALTNPRDPRVLHGDIHHENIRLSARGWLAYDPKGLYGERAYDLANTLCNPRPIYGVIPTDEGRIVRNATILAQTCGIERSRILLFLYLYAYLTVSWTLAGAATGWEVATISQIAQIAERNK